VQKIWSSVFSQKVEEHNFFLFSYVYMYRYV
jgi:hypothetical protein